VLIESIRMTTRMLGDTCDIAKPLALVLWPLAF